MERGSAPIAEMCTKRWAPASRASRARRAGADMVHHLEALRAAFVKDADEVDDAIIVRDEGRQQRLVADRDVDEPDLADIALQPEELGGRGVAPADGQHPPRSASRLTT